VSNELNYQTIESTRSLGRNTSKPRSSSRSSCSTVVGSGTKADARVGTAVSQGAGEVAVVRAGARADAGAEARAGTIVSQGAGTVVRAGARAGARAGTEVSQGAGTVVRAGAEARTGTEVSQGAEAISRAGATAS
jgi:hypothetical protein